MISEILNSYLEIKEEDKSNRWVCYNDKEEYVFGNSVKAIIHYCENIGKEETTTPEQENTLLHNVIVELKDRKYGLNASRKNRKYRGCMWKYITQEEASQYLRDATEEIIKSTIIK